MNMFFILTLKTTLVTAGVRYAQLLPIQPIKSVPSVVLPTLIYFLQDKPPLCFSCVAAANYPPLYEVSLLYIRFLCGEGVFKCFS
jgi:hypothetical protein